MALTRPHDHVFRHQPRVAIEDRDGSGDADLSWTAQCAMKSTADDALRHTSRLDSRPPVAV
jgi:hypothetical protein